MDDVPVSVVIPAYNAAPFLAQSVERAVAWLAERGGPFEVVVVDDGSSDGTPDILADLARLEPVRVLRHEPNRGKGYAVRRGMLEATGARRVFLDAGLTYPPSNLEPVLRALADGADVAIGSRVHPESRYTVACSAFRTLYLRHLMGRTYNRIVRAAVVGGVSDTQAGIKGMTAAAAEALFSRARLERFAFDVEVLYLARRLGLRVVEVPVRFEYRDERSTLRLVRDGARMLRDLLSIRRRARRGAYELPAPSGSGGHSGRTKPAASP